MADSAFLCGSSLSTFLDSARSQRARERSIRRFIHRLIAIKTFPSGSFDVDAAHIVGPDQLEPLTFFAASMPPAAAPLKTYFLLLVTRYLTEKRTIFVKILLQKSQIQDAGPSIIRTRTPS